MNEPESRYLTVVRAQQRRKKKRRRTVLSLIAVLLIAAAAFTLIRLFAPGIISSRQVRKRLETADSVIVPDYVDVQLLPVGPARTGIRLTDVKNIVVHYVGNPGSTAQNNHDYFAKRTTEVCSHFLIGLDGEVIQNVPLNEKSAASNNRNIDTISIEVCHPDESGKFNDATYDSLVRLTAWLCRTFSLKQTDVIRHYDVTGKLCPLYFVEHPDAWEDFLDDVGTEFEKKERNDD